MDSGSVGSLLVAFYAYPTETKQALALVGLAYATPDDKPQYRAGRVVLIAMAAAVAYTPLAPWFDEFAKIEAEWRGFMADASNFWNGEDEGFGGKSRADKQPNKGVPRDDKETLEFDNARPSTATVRAAEDQERLDKMLVKFPGWERKGPNFRKLNWSKLRSDPATMQTLREIIVVRGDDNQTWLNETKYKEVKDKLEGKP